MNPTLIKLRRFVEVHALEQVWPGPIYYAEGPHGINAWLPDADFSIQAMLTWEKVEQATVLRKSIGDRISPVRMHRLMDSNDWSFVEFNQR